MGDTLRAILVGCGNMSRSWLEASRDLDNVEILGLVDLDVKRAETRNEEFGFDAHTSESLEEALEHTRPDAVFDCTVPEAHLEVTLAALARGCHVLGEKPLADSMARARKMVRAAEDAGLIYAVIQNRRYMESIRRLRRLVASGAIGQITTVNSDFFIGAHFGGFRDRMEHPLILDMAVHTFDAARFLTAADPVSVYCREWNPAGSWYDHDASAVAIFELQGGGVYTYRGSWCAEGLNTSWESEWRILGSRGSITWDGNDRILCEEVSEPGGFKSEVKRVAIPDLDSSDRVDGHAGIIGEFAECVLGGGTPETVCTDNIRSLAMVFGAIDSARRDRRVAVEW